MHAQFKKKISGCYAPCSEPQTTSNPTLKIMVSLVILISQSDIN